MKNHTNDLYSKLNLPELSRVTCSTNRALTKLIELLIKSIQFKIHESWWLLTRLLCHFVVRMEIVFFFFITLKDVSFALYFSPVYIHRHIPGHSIPNYSQVVPIIVC